MSDAKTRAAARRQAILAGKSDRLAKLTTKAKNDGDIIGNARDPDDDPPLAELPSGNATSQSRSQFASRTPKKTPSYSSAITPERANVGGAGMEDASFGWDPVQQEHFMRALMNSQSREGTPQLAGLPSAFGQRGTSPFPMPDAFASAMPQVERPKTLLEKLLPLLHAASTILFLLFFLSWTNASSTATEGMLSTDHWRRWGDLATSKPAFGWSSDHRHVLWAFLSLQVALHSLRIFTHSSPPRVPMLLSLALPHLPHPFPMVIQTGMRYMQMAGLLLDDVSILVVGIGAVIFLARWYTTS